MKRAFVLSFLLALPVLAGESLSTTTLNAQNTYINNLTLLYTDWAQRVMANGGALPSDNTINAMETLRVGCIAAGITNKIHSLCVFVPDSIIATSTPLFKHSGSDPWTNNNFVIGDLDINGLKGDGTTKSFDTGVKPKVVQLPASGSTIGLTCIISEANSNRADYISGQQDADNDPVLALLVSFNGVSEFYPVETSASLRISTNDFGRVGYVSGNRWVGGGVTNFALFVASPLESHKILASSSSGAARSPTATEDTISVFAEKMASTNRGWSSKRLSLAMVHDGFTETESSNFWVLAQACREQLGGGTGDPVHDYNRKIVAAGGAAISTTTSNALRTFYGGLNTDGTLDLMSVVNPIVPDNLTAARTPIIWQSGSEVWTNFAFGSTNLSVTGLQANGTDKYLGTGIVPSTANRISATSAGISGIVTASPGTATQVILAGNPATANVQCALFTAVAGGDNTQFRLWRNDLVNQNFLSSAHPSPGDTWTGYISGNRTGASAIGLYVASTTLAHTTLTNATGAQTGTAAANTVALLAFASNGNGTPASFGNHTMSFVAFHGGLTATQSSNLWRRVETMRNSFGGGAP